MITHLDGMVRSEIHTRAMRYQRVTILQGLDLRWRSGHTHVDGAAVLRREGADGNAASLPVDARPPQGFHLLRGVLDGSSLTADRYGKPQAQHNVVMTMSSRLPIRQFRQRMRRFGIHSRHRIIDFGWWRLRSFLTKKEVTSKEIWFG